MAADKKFALRWSPAATGLAVSFSTAALLVAALIQNDGGISPTWHIPVLGVVLGMFAALFHVRRLRGLLAGLLIGFALAVFSSVSLLVQPVENLFLIVVATLGFFVILGLLAGSFVEFVFFLHYVSHGGDPRRYPGPPRKA